MKRKRRAAVETRSGICSHALRFTFYSSRLLRAQHLGNLDAQPVFDHDHSGRPPAERNGYVFHHTDNRAIESALNRALRLWFARPREFRGLAANGMHADHSWRRPGQDYLDIYSRVQHW